MTTVRQVADLAGNDGLPLACPNTLPEPSGADTAKKPG